MWFAWRVWDKLMRGTDGVMVAVKGLFHFSDECHFVVLRSGTVRS